MYYSPEGTVHSQMWDCGDKVQTKAWRALADHDTTPGRNSTSVFTTEVDTEMGRFFILRIILGGKFKREGRAC